jgi:hypothetical protein
MTQITQEQLAISGPCRDMRHAWFPEGDYVLIQEQGQVRHFKRVLKCYRCETVRTDEYKVSRVAVARVKTKYEYVQGYQIRGGARVADIRFAMFRDAPMTKEESA